jgi:hypothetical protein
MLRAGEGPYVIIPSSLRKRWMGPRVESRYGKAILQLRPAITPSEFFSAVFWNLMPYVTIPREFRCHLFLTLRINFTMSNFFLDQAGGVPVLSCPDFTEKFAMSPNFCPGTSRGQKWWPTVLGKRNSMQRMGRLSMHSCWAHFFPFWSGVGWAELFFLFFCFECVPKWFSSSQSVLKCIPQDVPSSTWVLSHMVCTKFNFYV